jgi:hypothetical protein
MTANGWPSRHTMFNGPESPWQITSSAKVSWFANTDDAVRYGTACQSNLLTHTGGPCSPAPAEVTAAAGSGR